MRNPLRRALLALAALASGVVVGQQADVPRAAAACGGAALTATQLNAVFANPGVGGGAGYAGGDYQHVYPLPDGRNLWLFQDMFFSADNDLRDSLGAAAHNAGLVQDGNCWTKVGGPGMQNYIGSSLTTPLRRWFWPMDGEISADGLLWIFMVEMSNPRGTGAGYGAVPVGTWIARIDTTSLAVVSLTRAPDPGTRLYGWSVVSDDQYSYLYGHCYRQYVNNVNSVAQFDATCMPHTYLARVPKGHFELAPEYWTGGGWGGAAAAKPLMTRGSANPMDVQRFGNVYVNVTKIDDWWGAWLYVDKAPNPWGPWENDRAIWMVDSRKCSQCGIYHAHLLPGLVDGQMVLSWSNGAPYELWYANAFLYRPSFLAVPLPAFRTDAAASGLELQPQAPLRIVDTRTPSARVKGGTVLTVPMAGKVPANAIGVVANLTAVNPAGTGYLTAWPCGARMPLASVLNTTTGRNTANGLHVRLDPQQRLCVYASIDTDVLVDVAGTYVASGPAGIHTLPATRVADTTGGAPLAAKATLEVPIAGQSGVPANGVAAVTATVSVTSPAGKGYLTVWPCGQTMPVVSTLNFNGGDSIANSTTMPVGTGGKLCVYTSIATHVAVDLVGWWDGSGASARLDVATRVLETRTGPKPTAGSTVTADLGTAVPGGTTAVIGNVTVVQPDATGGVLAWNCATSSPPALTLVGAPGENRAAVGLSAVSTGGDVCLTTSPGAHLLLDVMVSF